MRLNRVGRFGEFGEVDSPLLGLRLVMVLEEFGEIWEMGVIEDFEMVENFNNQLVVEELLAEVFHELAQVQGFAGLVREFGNFGEFRLVVGLLGYFFFL